MEGFLPYDHQYRPWPRVRRRCHRTLPPPAHMARQAESFARSLLSPEPSKHHESSRNLGGVCRRDLSSGISRGDTSQELSTAWNAWQLPSPIVLVCATLHSYLKPILCLRETLEKMLIVSSLAPLTCPSCCNQRSAPIYF